MVGEAKSTLVGIAVVVEKAFSGGREKLEGRYDVPVMSLVTITHLSESQIVFADDELQPES